MYTMKMHRLACLISRLRFSRSRNTLACVVATALSLLTSSTGHTQARVDLEDLSVKGELLNDNRLRMSSRESTRIQDRVKYRKNFRSEILDGADVRVPASEALEDVEAK